MNLNPEQARKKLVEALRSGDYEQGKARLKSGNKFCCLGVACDLYAKHERPESGWHLEDDIGWTFLGLHDLLPKEVMIWLGFATSNGMGKSKSSLSLDYLNDRGRSFEYISDVIENEEVKLIG